MQYDDMNDARDRQQLIQSLRQNIAKELQDRPQWATWLSTHDKKPRHAKDPNLLVRVDDPATWCSFEECLQSLLTNTALAGIGFIFSDHDPYTGIDVDSEGKVESSKLDLHRAIRAGLEAQCLSYCEWSPSGVGLHFIIRGRLQGDDGWKPKGLQIEVYSARRFFTMTGNLRNPAQLAIIDGQRFIDDFQRLNPKTLNSARVDIEDTTDGYRRTDLSHDDVFKFASTIDGFVERYNRVWTKTCGWDWSTAHAQLIGDLDKISGVAKQIKEIIYWSPFVQQSEIKQGERRTTKCERIFERELLAARARHDIRYSPPAQAHGASISQALNEEKKRKANAAYEAHEQKRNTSPFLRSVAGIIGDEYLKPSRPTGMVGQLVECIEQSTFYPSTARAIPVAFSFLSGVLGRRYKINGMGLNTYWIMTAPTGTGKSTALNALDREINKIEALMASQVVARARNGKRILKMHAASIQGLGDRFAEAPAFLWAVDEGKRQLAGMMTDKESHGIQLRDSIRDIYDCSHEHSVFNLPASRASNGRPIPNLNMSMLLMMTPDELDDSVESVIDGFMSRVVLVQLNDCPAFLEEDRQLKEFPTDVMVFLKTIVAEMDAIDDQYANPQAANPNVWPIFLDADAQRIKVETQRLVYNVTSKVVAGQLSENHHVINRLAMNALKLAGVLAVADCGLFGDPIMVRGHHLAWTTGYIAQNLAVTLRDLDSDKMGSNSNDEVRAVVRFFKDELERVRKHKKGCLALPKREFQMLCRDRKPFKGTTGAVKATALVGKTIDAMIQSGILRLGDDVAEIMMSDDPIWRN
jgi:hypothetical protein